MTLSNPLSVAAFWVALFWLMLWALTGWAGFTWLVIGSAVTVLVGAALTHRRGKGAHP